MQPTDEPTMDHDQIETGPATPARGRDRRTRRRVAAGLVATGLLLTGCTSGLKGASDRDGRDGGKEATRVDSATNWPEDGPLTATTSPAVRDVTIGVQPVLREADGTATVLLEVTNDGTESQSLNALVGDASLAKVALVDEATGDRWFPLAKDGSNCVCSTSVTVEAGATAALYATYADVPSAVESVRVAIPGWVPVDELQVRSAELPEAATATMPASSQPDVSLHVDGVWRTDTGTLLRITTRNEGSDPLSPVTMPSVDRATIVDADRWGAVEPRSDEDGVVVTKGATIGQDGTLTQDVLLSELPTSTERVLVVVPGARRSAPVTLGGTAPGTELTPGELRDPETAQLRSDEQRGTTPPIALTKVGLPSIDATGPEVELPDGGKAMTSPAQPGWAVVPRAVVRTGKQAVLYVDIANTGAKGSWPDRPITGPIGEDAGIALLDPAAQRRYGAVTGDDTFGSDQIPGISDGERRTVHVVFPALGTATRSVIVDVPGFGRSPSIPVLAGPTASDGPVLATMRVDGNARLRMDVLAVGRLTGRAGTILRVRLVNESDPDSVSVGFASEGNGLCNVTVTDPDTQRRFKVLDPCVGTPWNVRLGSGDQIVEEVRLPNLPADVARVVVDADGWTSTSPVAVADSGRPTLLDLPRPAGTVSGDTGEGSVGVADDLQTEVRQGDQVDLRLNTDVLFAFGSADLSPDAGARLQTIGQRLASQASGTVTVTGYTDSIGADAANQALSERRANAVAAALRQASGGQLTFEVLGKGETDPVAPNDIDGRDNPDGRARNRRVTVSYTAR